jgi:hypothetical protein
MRIVGPLLCLLWLACPTIASGQSFMLQGSAGPTVSDRGHSLAGGFGFTPTSHVGLLFEAERTHLASRMRGDGRGGLAAFRGGTLTMALAEVRVALLGRNRTGPYALGGFAGGVSRPNVNAAFPDRVTNEVRAMFFGGGIHVPLREQISVFSRGTGRGRANPRGSRLALLTDGPSYGPQLPGAMAISPESHAMLTPL